MPEEVTPLPPSSKAVLLALALNGELDQQQLADATGLTQRTIRFAIDKLLEDTDLVTKTPKMGDARKHLYSTSWAVPPHTFGDESPDSTNSNQ
jgi:DNA-binding MarR family transcriptional regulator